MLYDEHMLYDIIASSSIIKDFHREELDNLTLKESETKDYNWNNLSDREVFEKLCRIFKV